MRPECRVPGAGYAGPFPVHRGGTEKVSSLESIGGYLRVSTSWTTSVNLVVTHEACQSCNLCSDTIHVSWHESSNVAMRVHGRKRNGSSAHLSGELPYLDESRAFDREGGALARTTPDSVQGRRPGPGTTAARFSPCAKRSSGGGGRDVGRNSETSRRSPAGDELARTRLATNLKRVLRAHGATREGEA